MTAPRMDGMGDVASVSGLSGSQVMEENWWLERARPQSWYMTLSLEQFFTTFAATRMMSTPCALLTRCHRTSFIRVPTIQRSRSGIGEAWAITEKLALLSAI